MSNIFNREEVPCVFLQVACDDCGPVCAAQAALPPEPLTACPICAGDAPWELLYEGKTSRFLPFFSRASTAADNHQKTGPSDMQVRAGQIVIYCEEANVFHMARIQDVWTSVASGGGVVPAVSFMLGDELSAPIRHISVTNDLPWWCTPGELKQEPVGAIEQVKQAVTEAVKRVRGKHDGRR